MSNKENPNFFAIIPADVRYADITPNAKLLYGEITALCSKEGFCWAGNPYFAKLYNASERTIKRWVLELENMGAISVSRTNNKRSIIINSRVTKMSLLGDKNVTQQGDKNVTHSNTDRLVHKNTASSGDAAMDAKRWKGSEEPMSWSQFYQLAIKDNQRHIRLIADWADTLRPELETKGQWHLFIKRNLRAAQQLTAFRDEQIRRAFEKIEQASQGSRPWLRKYTMETLLKFLV